MTAAVSDAGQDKKEEKFPAKVTLRPWDAQGKKFLNPVENVKAKFVEIGKTDKKPAWRLDAATSLNGPTVGSEIIEADGKTTWKVTKVVLDASDFHIAYAEKVEPPKP